VFKRGFAPLKKLFPLPLGKGKGIKGIGLLNKIKRVRLINNLSSKSGAFYIAVKI